MSRDLTHKTDHKADGLSRLLYQFRGKQRIAAVLGSYLDQIQDLEDELWQLLTLRWIDTAEGEQLNGLGRIVGEPRKGSGDEEYRAFLRARVRVNLSDGHLYQLVQIVNLITGEGVRAREYYPAAIRLEPQDSLDVSAIRVGDMLQDAKPGGVALVLVYSKVDRSETLTLGWSGGAGIADSQSPGYSGTTGIGGGKFAGTV